ncbi:MAG: CAP domain-containing protein [Acidobacteriaceae bacterium]|jgi:uncharacterized protein YkwD
MKPLHASPHLLLALTATMALLPCAVAQHSAISADTPTIAEQYLLSAANQERAARNLPLLHRDPLLARAAAQHAQAMATHGSISHQFPGEPELAHRGASMGVAFSLISENVAEAPSAIQIHDMWMHSEGHRANLLDPAIDSVGIRVIARNGELYAVEDFARTVPSASLEEQESAIGALVAQPGRISLTGTPDAIAAARQTCAMDTGFAGARKPWFVMRFTSSSLTQLPDELKTRLASGRYRQAAVGACAGNSTGPFTSYNIAVLLYP